jgi:Rps23 Pro-64 3,4-dihydroxylase Tpa1-like proline 4-hydroxylase
MDEVIREECLTGEYVAQKMKEFEKGKPFSHVVCDGFLKKEVIVSLIKGIEKEGFEEKRADLFHFLQTADLHSSREKALKQLVKVLDSADFASYLTRITGVKVKAGASDVFGSFYGTTHYLLCHNDQLEGRKLAFIFYLTTLPERAGGALALRADGSEGPGNIMTRIHPKAGRLVVFEVSRKSWHQVEEVTADVKRYALGGWLH